MKVEIDAHEIVEAEISKISLVKRGANRAPFKIMKAEDEHSRNLAQKVTKTHGPQPREDTSWLARKDTSLDALERHAQRNRNGGGW